MRRWTKAEERALQKLYPGFLRGRLTREILEAIMQRSWYSINNKASDMRLTGKAYLKKISI